MSTSVTGSIALDLVRWTVGPSRGRSAIISPTSVASARAMSSSSWG